jgi:hypothetical protein
MRLAVVALSLLLGFPALATPSGVLIGLRDNNNTYRTIWVVAESGGPAVAATIGGLVVPREDGLWRVDVERRSCGEVGQYVVDELHIGPLDSGSERLPTTDCESVAKEYCGATYPRGGDLTVEHWLLYVGSTYFAERFWYTDSCGAHLAGETAFSVHQIDQPAQEIAIEMAANLDSLQSAAREALICGTDDMDCIDTRDHYQLFRSSGWGIVRGVGQWSILVALSPSEPAYHLGPAQVVTGLPAPAEIVGPTTSDMTTSTNRPEGDRSISPERDMVLVRTGRLQAYRLVGDAVEGPPASIPARSDEQVVMIEWVPAARVSQWDAVLRGLSP